MLRQYLKTGYILPTLIISATILLDAVKLWDEKAQVYYKPWKSI
jgi:hypothetical protein